MCKTGRLRVSDWPGMDESLVTTPLANAHGFCLFAPSHFSHLTFFFLLTGRPGSYAAEDRDMEKRLEICGMGSWGSGDWGPAVRRAPGRTFGRSQSTGFSFVTRTHAQHARAHRTGCSGKDAGDSLATCRAASGAVGDDACPLTCAAWLGGWDAVRFRAVGRRGTNTHRSWGAFPFAELVDRLFLAQ